MKHFQSPEVIALNRLSYDILTPTGSSPSSILAKSPSLRASPYSYVFHFALSDFKDDMPYCLANLDLTKAAVLSKTTRFHLFCFALEHHFGQKQGFNKGIITLSCVTICLPASDNINKGGGFLVVFYTSDNTFFPAFLMEHFVVNRKQKRLQKQNGTKKKKRSRNGDSPVADGKLLQPSKTPLRLEYTVSDFNSLVEMHALVTGIFYFEQRGFRRYHESWFRMRKQMALKQTNNEDEPQAEDDMESAGDQDIEVLLFAFNYYFVLYSPSGLVYRYRYQMDTTRTSNSNPNDRKA